MYDSKLKITMIALNTVGDGRGSKILVNASHISYLTTTHYNRCYVHMLSGETLLVDESPNDVHTLIKQAKGY